MIDHDRAIRGDRRLAGLRLRDPELRGPDVAGVAGRLLGDELRVRLRRGGAISAQPGDIGEPPRHLAREPRASEVGELVERGLRRIGVTGAQRDHPAQPQRVVAGRQRAVVELRERGARPCQIVGIVRAVRRPELVRRRGVRHRDGEHHEHDGETHARRV